MSSNKPENVYFDPASQTFRGVHDLYDLVKLKAFNNLDPISKFRVAINHGLDYEREPGLYQALLKGSREYQAVHDRAFRESLSGLEIYNLSRQASVARERTTLGDTNTITEFYNSRESVLSMEKLKKIIEQFYKDNNYKNPTLFPHKDENQAVCFHEVMITPPTDNLPSMYVCLKCGEEVRVGEELKRKNMKWAEGYEPSMEREKEK